ncbi:MAG: helix-turn-helix transcriptional regulator [Gammaproteobacteria bacterium]|nr:helix-turn-helix transcriptional regulator [Gammaproteobacteria bacterium]
MDVARETGLNRNTLPYKETVSRVDLDTLDNRCNPFGCTVADLFEYLPDH